MHGERQVGTYLPTYLHFKLEIRENILLWGTERHYLLTFQQNLAFLSTEVEACINIYSVVEFLIQLIFFVHSLSPVQHGMESLRESTKHNLVQLSNQYIFILIKKSSHFYFICIFSFFITVVQAGRTPSWKSADGGGLGTFFVAFYGVVLCPAVDF